MKKNIKSEVRRREFNYRLIPLIALFCFVFLSTSDGQRIQHTIEREIPLSDESRIKINGPESVRITGVGTICTRQVGDKYIVSRKSSTPDIYNIDKKLIINTWDKKAIKQVSTLSFSCKTTAQEKQLKEALAINLVENAAGTVEVDCELNIDKFQLENGWFTTENNHIILDNGKVYPINYLSISTMLYLPSNGQVTIDSEENDIVVDRLEGELEIDVVGGSLTAKEISKLKGNISFAEINVEQIGSATLELQNTKLKANSIHQLKLESAISKVEIKTIEKLEVTKSLNDHFYLETVQAIKVTNSIYSNYNLASCNESLEMTLKGGDVDIKNYGPLLKFAIIKNRNAKIQIDLESLESYSLTINSFDQSKYSLPNNFVLIKTEDEANYYKLGSNPEQTIMQIDCIHCEVTMKN